MVVFHPGVFDRYLPFTADGAEPQHERGVCSEEGLYFLGLDFLYSFASENVGGVRRDARHIAKHIASRR